MQSKTRSYFYWTTFTIINIFYYVRFTLTFSPFTFLYAFRVTLSLPLGAYLLFEWPQIFANKCIWIFSEHSKHLMARSRSEGSSYIN